MATRTRANEFATEFAELGKAIEQKETAKVYQLALWDEDQRAMPTEFVRSALFAAIQGKDATHLDRVEIANANDLRIVYTGKRLTQVHADVWEGIMHLARNAPEQTQIKFRARSFLRLIGRPTGKRQREELKSWWAQLTATCVEVHDKKHERRYFGSLVPRGADRDENNDTVYVVEINRDLAKLFERGYSTVNWNQRKLLLKKPLALWLQHHFSAYPKPVTVQTLYNLSGSSAKQLRQFRARLKIALTELEKCCVLASWRLDERDTVHIKLAEPAPPASDPSLGGPSGAAAKLSAVTRSRFVTRHPDHSYEQCVSDWQGWSGSRKAKNPDAAFLGFARKWAETH